MEGNVGFQCQVWMPYGYSPVYRNNARELWFRSEEVLPVLGLFKTISFHTKRLGTYLAEVTMTRTGVPGQESDVVEIFAGRCVRTTFFGAHGPDLHKLKTGQELTITHINHQLVSCHIYGKPS